MNINKTSKGLAALSMLLVAATGAQASVLAGNASGGSEAILSLVNVTGDSISQDLGEQVGAINVGDSYSLGASLLSFISAAGGAANVTFGIIAGNTTDRNYLTSSGNATFVDDVAIGNAAKSNWAGSLNGLITNLNNGDATPTATNLAYGPFAAGSGGANYVDGLYDSWTSGDFNLSNLTPGNSTLYLYNVAFAVSNLGFAGISQLGGGQFANLNLTTNKLEIGPTAAVPAPAAVWLMGTALVPLARRAWSKSRKPA